MKQVKRVATALWIFIVAYIIFWGMQVHSQNALPKDRILCEISKKAPQLPMLEVDSFSWNSKEIAKQFFSDDEGVETRKTTLPFGTWTEFAVVKHVKIGSWGDVWFTIESQRSSNKDNGSEKELKEKAQKFIQRYIKDLGQEVKIQILTKESSKVVFTHSFKEVPILSVKGYGGDRIEVSFKDGRITEVAIFWHKVIKPASSPIALSPQRALEEALRKGKSLLKDDTFKITNIGPMYFINWFEVKPGGKPVMKPGWMVEVKTKGKNDFLCIDGVTNKLVPPISFVLDQVTMPTKGSQ